MERSAICKVEHAETLDHARRMGQSFEMHFLAISGSLRAGASNTALLEAVRLAAAPEVTVTMYDGLDRLPYFNPDLDTVEGDRLPETVIALRTLVGQVDGLLICSPEYAHGIPGVLKNALDWLVGSVEFPGKAVALLSTSSRSVHARAQLTEVLTTMSARLIPEASVVILVPGRDVDASAIVADPVLATTLREVIDVLVRVVADPAS